jgi:hypothetical protein
MTHSKTSNSGHEFGLQRGLTEGDKFPTFVDNRAWLALAVGSLASSYPLVQGIELGGFELAEFVR